MKGIKTPDIKLKLRIWQFVSGALAAVIVVLVISPHIPSRHKSAKEEASIPVADYLAENMAATDDKDTVSDGMIWMSDELSDRIFYTHERDGAAPAQVFDHKTNTVLEDSIEFARFSNTDNRMLLFRRNGKYGYISCRTGKAVIPEQYDEAFPFSEGRAAVVKGETLYFIDYKGNPVNDKRFSYEPMSEYIYYGNLCIASNRNGYFGLIDKNGNWVVAPKYEHLEPLNWNLWQASFRDEAATVLNRIYNQKGKLLTNLEFTQISYDPDYNGFICTLPDYTQVVVDETGKVRPVQ